MKKYLLFSLVCISFVACNNTETPAADSGTVSNGLPAPKPITFTIDSIYPHDPKAFTQGLQYYKGKLYEGTGMEEESNLRIVNLKTGKPEINHHIADPAIFGEGITIFNNKIYQLTWKNHKVFVYNVTDITKPVTTFNWPKEGWGITSDGTNLIISDGTANLYYVSPEDFKTLKIVSVSDNTGPLDMINELEYINGYIFANRWQTDDILKIDPGNGHVVGKMDFKGVLQQYAAKEITNDTNYLNGIAYDSATNKLFITGKNWPKLFEIRLNN